MGLISITNPADGETVDASDVSTPFNTIKNVINGNIDNDNIAAGAGILVSKIGNTAWSAFTPTWTGLTLGNGTTGAYYQRIGTWVIYKGYLSCGTTTNTTGIGSPIYCDFPVTAKATSNLVDMGVARITDNSGGKSSNASVLVLSATQCFFYASPDVTQAIAANYPTGYFVSGAGNSTGDTITWTLTYEAA